MQEIEKPTVEFTQKDLMQHLLNVSQHAATREELQDVKKDLSQRIDGVEQSLNQRIDGVERRINSVEQSLGRRIDALDKKFDRFMWIIVSLLIVSLFKPQLIALFS